MGSWGETGNMWWQIQEGQRPNNANTTQNKESKQKEEITQDDFPELSTEWGEAHTVDENKPTLWILLWSYRSLRSREDPEHFQRGEWGRSSTASHSQTAKAFSSEKAFLFGTGSQTAAECGFKVDPKRQLPTEQGFICFALSNSMLSTSCFLLLLYWHTSWQAPRRHFPSSWNPSERKVQCEKKRYLRTWKPTRAWLSLIRGSSHCASVSFAYFPFSDNSFNSTSTLKMPSHSNQKHPLPGRQHAYQVCKSHRTLKDM